MLAFAAWPAPRPSPEPQKLCYAIGERGGGMRIEVTKADWRKGREVHRLFKAKRHSEHIASEFALAHLAAVLRTNEIRSVLEFGAGIETITYLILSSLPETSVECTERHPLCLDALEQNISPDLRDRPTIYNDEQPVSGLFDLIVMDGKSDTSAVRLDEGAICFAEGGRTKARATLGPTLKERGLSADFTQYRPRRSIGLRPTRWEIPLPKFDRKGC